MDDWHFGPYIFKEIYANYNSDCPCDLIFPALKERYFHEILYQLRKN